MVIFTLNVESESENWNFFKYGIQTIPIYRILLYPVILLFGIDHLLTTWTLFSVIMCFNIYIFMKISNMLLGVYSNISFKKWLFNIVHFTVQ